MCKPFVTALLGLSISLALASGSAVAKVSKDGKNAATKTVATKKNDSISKDAAARRSRIKKMGSATPKETQKSKAAKKAKLAQAQATQMASNSDGGSVDERRARIHTMRVPE
jgi:hypothetical protein